MSNGSAACDDHLKCLSYRHLWWYPFSRHRKRVAIRWTRGGTPCTIAAVVFTWAALLLVAVRRSNRPRAVFDSDYGTPKAASALGRGIWLVMLLAVISCARSPPAAFNGAYLAMLLLHIFFVD